MLIEMREDADSQQRDTVCRLLEARGRAVRQVDGNVVVLSDTDAADLSDIGLPGVKRLVAMKSAYRLVDRAVRAAHAAFSEGAFPCTDCHDPEFPVNGKRRELVLAHDEIELRHDEEHRWCLDCHDGANRDQLHLANGTPVPFEESYRLCGQCHGDKYRDWRAGVHGRRTGSWDGPKQYLLCVHCHNAHAPAFQPIAPEPAPQRPRRTP